MNYGNNMKSYLAERNAWLSRGTKRFIGETVIAAAGLAAFMGGYTLLWANFN